MSKVYSKSISPQYASFFEPISTLEDNYSAYSLKSQAIIKSKSQLMSPWMDGSTGVPLAWQQAKGTVIVDQTDDHTLVVGPTGSKKTRLIAMPTVRTLCCNGESMIISDPKAEIFNRTGAYLEDKGYSVYVLNIRSPRNGVCWNPLAIPYDYYCKGDVDTAYEYVNDIAENLIQSEKSQNDPFWDNSAGSFFFGLVLLLFKYCKDFNIDREYVHIGNVVNLRNILLTGTNTFQLGKSIRYNAELWSYAKNDPIISSALIGTVETANDTRAGILSVFDQKIRFFSIQPNLLDMLSRNDIDFYSIGKKPTAIFIIVPDEKTGYHSLVSLFIKQSYEFLIHNAQIEPSGDGFRFGKLSNRVNYILDEFSSLPTIRDFPAMVTAARSRNIRFLLIIQSKHQLIQRYKEEAETIQTNCNNWIFLTSRELKLLEELSALCGNDNANPPKPVLSVSHLQKLSKEDGEALLLFGRSKPCITRLADISEYDQDQYDIKRIGERIPLDLKYLDFKISQSDSE